MVFPELRLVDHMYLFSDAILLGNSTTNRLLMSKDQVKGYGQVRAFVGLKNLYSSSDCSGANFSAATTICNTVTWKVRRNLLFHAQIFLLFLFFLFFFISRHSKK